MKSEVGEAIAKNNKTYVKSNNLWKHENKYYPQKKQCPCCGKIFKFGRTDKVYCSSKCKSHMYNVKIKSKFCFIQLINKQLKANRNILKAVNEHFKETQKMELITMGFNFKYYTGIQFVHNEKYKLCYDYGYKFAKNKAFVNIIHIVLNDNQNNN